MGKADTATANFMRQNDVFADAFNFFLYQGDPVINPKQLRELDPAELAMSYGADRKSEPVQKYRDILKGLAEMVGTEDEAVLARIPDYRINLVTPAQIGKEEFGKFHSSLGDVLEFIKYSSDKKKLMEWLHEEKPELTMGRKEVEVLNACVNAKLAMKPEEEEVEVCKAIEDYKMEAVEKATKEVTEKVTKQVTKQVTESTRLSALKNLIKNTQWTAQQAAGALGFSAEDTAKLLGKL